MREDRGPELAAVLGLFLGLAWLFTSLRVYVKLRLSKSWGSDDTLLIISLIFFTTYCSCSATGVHYGTGQHISSIPAPSIPKALYNWWLCELFYTLTTFTLRLSIAAFFLRLCVKRIHTYIIICTVAMVGVFSTFYFFFVVFQCHPVSYFWAQYEGEQGSCINPAAVPMASVAHSAVSFTADWIFALLPILLLYHLNMNQQTKISVAVLLSLGLLAGIAAMIRVPYIKILALTDDFLYATTDVAIWSTIEPGLGIIAFAGATFRPLFRSFYNLTTHTRSHTKSQSRNSKRRSSIFGLLKPKNAVNRDGYIINDGDQNLGNLEPNAHNRDWTGKGKGKHTTTTAYEEVDGVSMMLRPDVLSIPSRVVISKGSPRYEVEEDPITGSGRWDVGGSRGIEVHRSMDVRSMSESPLDEEGGLDGERRVRGDESPRTSDFTL